MHILSFILRIIWLFFSLSLFFFVFLSLNRFRQRTTDADALDLYNKKVKVVNPKTGEITYKFYSPDIGMKKVKQGGKSMDVNWFRWQFYAYVKFSNKIALASEAIGNTYQMNFQSGIFFSVEKYRWPMKKFKKKKTPISNSCPLPRAYGDQYVINCIIPIKPIRKCQLDFRLFCILKKYLYIYFGRFQTHQM